jgi:uroporphyrinogen-III synthase
MRYEDNVSKVPAVAIGSTTADELEALLNKQNVTAKLNSNCGMKGEKLSHSVIGEITGKKTKASLLSADI